MLRKCFVAVRSTHVYVHTRCSGGSNGALGQKRIEKPFPVWAKILPPAAAGGSIVHLKRIILDRTCGPFTQKTLTAGLTRRGHMKTEKRFCSTERSIFGPWHYGCKTHHNETSYLLDGKKIRPRRLAGSDRALSFHPWPLWSSQLPRWMEWERIPVSLASSDLSYCPSPDRRLWAQLSIQNIGHLL